jgi:23S rRNA C2498 (ribose-2'-O)-methylase RlmM
VKLKDRDTAVEIGSAPGGASYALLKRGEGIKNLMRRPMPLYEPFCLESYNVS